MAEQDTSESRTFILEKFKEHKEGLTISSFKQYGRDFYTTKRIILELVQEGVLLEEQKGRSTIYKLKEGKKRK